MDLVVATYLAYIALAVPLTVWVAHTLSTNGRHFLVDVFSGDSELAQAVNRLLVVGFYLLNLGFVALYLRVSGPVESARAVVETLSVKLGVVLLVLGVVHLTNVWVFNRLRHRTKVDAYRTPPVGPQSHTPPAFAPVS
ncbi:membrane protein [Knoellia sinensis KCTC 19936]|uniref:Membrane protein n=1 Tax=Knoellia sinensis KCTC 19936 TaxID=1385520 RepID=A0A0A0J4M1_9MICO|nr:hypothetical protein [Knoellia sinensis]KGN31694.1 membrane protein [Knoellia sinensis KCTC 19936]